MSKIKSRSDFKGLKLLVAGLVVTVLAITDVALVRAQGLQPRGNAANVPAMKITEPFTFAAVGDIVAPYRPFAQLDDPGFQALVKVMRSADMTYANLEGPIVNVSDQSYHGPQTPAGGEGVLFLPPTIIGDLKSMGIRVVTTANNHTMNDGIEGLFNTNRLLGEAGITHAGSGRDLTDAREARFGITPKGTIGVVGMFSIDTSSRVRERSSDATDYVPGLNPLHLTPYNIVTAEQMASLRKIRDASYAHRSEVAVPVAPVPANESPDELSLFGTLYKVGDKVGSISYTMDPKDLAGIMQSIRSGKQNSDFLIVAIHCHQNSFSYQAYSHDNSTPDFLIDLAHKAIDNGADVFVGHGVHTLRGVEIYKGKPIFYGMASFVYQYPASERFDASTKAVLLATSRYEGGKLVEVRLYPCDSGIDGTRALSEEGIPMKPSPEQAQRILKLLQDNSKQFGTTIRIENGVGVIDVAQTK